MDDLRPEAVALAHGRFDECERLLGALGGGAGPALVLVVLRREQGRAGEADVLSQAFVADHREVAAGRAWRAVVLGDAGRDGEAWREMRRLSARSFSALAGDLAALVALAELCAVLEDDRQAAALHGVLAPCADRWAASPDGAVCTGSVRRGLGLLSHTLGDWDGAVAHFDAALAAHEAVGASLLVAHVRRELAATLRARGSDGDWERALDLLGAAAAIYHRLGVERLAAQARSVLRQSDALADDPGEAPLFRRDAEGWVLGWGGRLARLTSGPGLVDIATLLAHPRRSVHVWELAAADGGPAAAGYLDRLRQLDDDLARAEAADDRVEASLARVEREFVVGRLAAPADDGTLDPVRSAVVARIRAGLDRVERAMPELGRHLRVCINTGTFCTYEPDRPRAWDV